MMLLCTFNKFYVDMCFHFPWDLLSSKRKKYPPSQHLYGESGFKVSFVALDRASELCECRGYT